MSLYFAFQYWLMTVRTLATEEVNSVWIGELHDIWNVIITWNVIVASRTRAKCKLQFNCACIHNIARSSVCVFAGSSGRVRPLSCGGRKWLNRNSITVLTVEWMWALMMYMMWLWPYPHCVNKSRADFFLSWCFTCTKAEFPSME